MTSPMLRLKSQLVKVLAAHLTAGKPTAVPEAGRLLWRIFVDLSRGRTYHMSGPNPIAHTEIEAYARLHRWPLQLHHVEIIRALDDAWLQNAHAKQGKADGSAAPRSSGQKINPAAFDAVFG